VIPAGASGPRVTPKREQIAAIVDQILSSKLSRSPELTGEPEPTRAAATAVTDDSPVRTVIHELHPQSLTENGIKRDPVDFVSETDVRAAVEKGEKIYITAKTILTPAARDLGEEKDIFARV
jgi:hypothetical protein